MLVPHSGRETSWNHLGGSLETHEDLCEARVLPPMLYISSLRLHSSSCKSHGLLDLLHFVQISSKQVHFIHSKSSFVFCRGTERVVGPWQVQMGLGSCFWCDKRPSWELKVKGLKMPSRCLQRFLMSHEGCCNSELFKKIKKQPL